MNRLRRTRLQQLTLALVATSLLLRALVPAGFMPGARTALNGAPWLVFCSGLMLKHVDNPDAPQAPGKLVVEHCAFAASAAPALPSPPVGPPEQASALPVPAPTLWPLPVRFEPHRRPPVRAGPVTG